MWTEQNQELVETFTFSDFASALEFVNKVGNLAEALNHHPDIALSWGKVVIRLSTHSAHGVTVKDHRLAEAIDQLT